MNINSINKHWNLSINCRPCGWKCWKFSIGIEVNLKIIHWIWELNYWKFFVEKAENKCWYNYGKFNHGIAHENRERKITWTWACLYLCPCPVPTHAHAHFNVPSLFPCSCSRVILLCIFEWTLNDITKISWKTTFYNNYRRLISDLEPTPNPNITVNIFPVLTEFPVPYTLQIRKSVSFSHLLQIITFLV
jgi:hypothetical protein